MPNITHETAPTQFVQAGIFGLGIGASGRAERPLCCCSIILPRTWTTGIPR